MIPNPLNGTASNVEHSGVMSSSAGQRLRLAMEQEMPLQVAGAVNAYFAMMAEQAGFRALYLSGAGVANASYGLPDLGMTNLNDVLTDARRITQATDLPLLVDVDTGFGDAFGIARTIRDLAAVGVAGVHIEDQVQSKRCGHRPNKVLVEQEEMIDRVRAAVDAKPDPEFVVMARTDALAVEGMDSAIKRASNYVAAGADALFLEAVTSLDQYRVFAESTDVPVLANITEFGKTPLFTRDELAGVGIQLILYPLSAFRAASAAALSAYETLRRDGTQSASIEGMQSRVDLYKYLGYEEYERKLDELFSK